MIWFLGAVLLFTMAWLWISISHAEKLDRENKVLLDHAQELERIRANVVSKHAELYLDYENLLMEYYVACGSLSHYMGDLLEDDDDDDFDDE